MGRERKHKLLIVEDNRVMYKLAQKGLERAKAHCEVVHAENGKLGVEAARQERPDLVLLDWMMPEYDGEYFLAEQAQDEKLAGVPVLIYSARDEDELKSTLEDFPSVQGFIAKPLIPSKLTETILPYLRREK